MATLEGFWLSYDLGLKGDYSGLYGWLDSVKAKECGNGIAFFKMEIEEDKVKEVQEQIYKHVNLNQTDRLYLIYYKDKTKHVTGKFLSGGRKRAPWEGYFAGNKSTDEDIAE